MRFIVTASEGNFSEGKVEEMQRWSEIQGLVKVIVEYSIMTLISFLFLKLNAKLV